MPPNRYGPEPVVVSGDLVLRGAGREDVEAIVDLETHTFGRSDEPGLRAWLEAPGVIADWTVVVDGTEVVAASGLLAHRMALQGCRFPAGQIEYVATRAAWRRRGLVRAQFAWHHRRATERGDLALFIAGIPYFYRRFGYGYGLDHPEFVLPQDPGATSYPELSIRPATSADEGAIRRIDDLRSPTALRVERDDRAWSIILSACLPDTFEHLSVVERRDSEGAEPRIVGWMRAQDRPGDGRVYLCAAGLEPSEPAGTAREMMAYARRAAGDLVVVAFDQPGTHFGNLASDPAAGGSPVHHDHGVYVLIPDPVGLLDTLRPVLSDRFGASRYAARDGELVISLYEGGVALDLAGGAVTAVREVPGVEDPFAGDGVGVAPDWFGALVFGRWGAIGLEQRADDVILGRRRGLMEVLFPKVVADVVGDF